MNRKTDFERNLSFVTRYYRHGALSSRKGWRELNLSVSRRRSWRIAAAVAGIAVLSASAALYLRYDVQEPVTREVRTDRHEVTVGSEMKRIEFVNAPLSEVVAEVERVYDVHVTGLPEEAYTLTLSYEGTAAGLIETINTLLDTHLEIDE